MFILQQFKAPGMLLTVSGLPEEMELKGTEHKRPKTTQLENGREHFNLRPICPEAELASNQS